jgi:hypothetical protein
VHARSARAGFLREAAAPLGQRLTVRRNPLFHARTLLNTLQPVAANGIRGDDLFLTTIFN